MRIMALFSLVSCCWCSSWYLSPFGSDGNSGTSQGSPWLHIPFALQKARTGDTLYLMPGLFGNDNEFSLGWEYGINIVALDDPVILSCQGGGNFMTFVGGAIPISFTVSGNISIVGCNSAILIETGATTLSASVSGVTFQGNQYGIRFMAMPDQYCDPVNLQVSNSVFFGNTVAGIAITPYDTIHNVCMQASLTVDSCAFQGNGIGIQTQANYAAAFKSEWTVTNSVFQDNGAALNLEGGTLSLSSSELTGNGNLTDSIGSAVIGNGVALSVDNCELLNNAGVLGGAVYLQGESKFNAQNSVFQLNNATYGGAFYASDASLFLIQDSTVSNNTATTGGAVYCVPGKSGFFECISCTQQDNMSFDGSPVIDCVA